jgi:Flp pilus assembly protein TadG
MAFLRRILGKVNATRRRSALTLRTVLPQRWGRCAAWVGRSEDLAQSESGGSQIEFVLSLTALMTFVFAVMEICMVFYTYGMISECAREATRYAIVRGSTCLTSSSTSCTASATTISNYAKGLGFPNIGGGTLNVTTTFIPAGNQAPGSQVKVDIKYTVSIKVPFIPKNALQLDSSSEMYILQ